jgi:hypothetical protein
MLLFYFCIVESFFFCLSNLVTMFRELIIFLLNVLFILFGIRRHFPANVEW